MTKFCHLHSHTEASLADGLFGTKKWVKAIKERGFIAHAITDHGTMTNALAFYHQMRAEKLTPIIGCEFYYTRNPLDKTPANRKSSHLILLAKNYDGYQNLLKLQKLSFTDGYYFKNRIGLEWLSLYGEGLICLTACQGGVLAQEVWKELRGEVGEIQQRFQELSIIFGSDLYVEFQGHHTLSAMPDGTRFDSQALINETLYESLKDTKGFKQIVTNDCHYITKDHAKIQKMIKNISWKKQKDESAESGTVSEDHFCDSLWLKNAKEVYESFNEYHEYLPQRFVLEGIKHTHEVFEKCKDFALPSGLRYLPKFRPHIDSKKFFKAYTTKLLKEFLGSDHVVASKEDYIRRYKKELEVISKYGLEDYFLIVWDLVRYARSEGIATGLGRGSAAGCLISYLLGIVRADPLEFDLLFERFLNEHRCSGGELPDIDLDFESLGRSKIKKYIYETYGSDNVCEIGTYGRMKLKTSLLDFGKILNLASHKDLQKITKDIDLEKDSIDDLEKAMEGQEALKNLVDANPDYGFAVKNIIGQMKSQSIHPAGVLIASTPIADIIPVKTQKKNIKPEDLIEGEEKTQRVITSQPEDKYVIAEGLMKMDILGVKEYDIIKFVIQNDPKLIEAGYTLDNYVEKIMKLNKQGRLAKVWKLFCQGETSGVFQFSSEGMQGLLKMMQPRHMDDLIAANALYRPGCLNNGWHILYCDRKNGKEETTYVHEIVERITSNTFGVLVFQEQFMRIINELGGIDLVESDNIRSALGKKNKEKLAKYGPMFIEGASKHISSADAEKLWEQIIHASEYSFNKSHSCSYSILAFISQFLKIVSPSYFFAAHFFWNIKKKETEDLLRNKKIAQSMGIEFVLPHINKSTDKMVVEGKKVISSLSLVKMVGLSAVKEIISKQPFASFDDFHKRVNKAKVKYNVIQNLIFAGAFDEFGDRKILLKELAERTKNKEYEGYNDQQMMIRFYDCVGFYEQKIKSVIPGFSDYCVSQEELKEFDDKDEVRVGGIITAVRSHVTKKGDKMGFCTLEDLDEKFEITIFPEAWAEERKKILVGNIVEIHGKKSEFNGKQNAIEAIEFTTLDGDFMDKLSAL